MKTPDEIRALADDASDIINTGTSKYPGMSYEEGVRAALEWVLGETPDDEPIL